MDTVCTLKWPCQPKPPPIPVSAAQHPRGTPAPITLCSVAVVAHVGSLTARQVSGTGPFGPFWRAIRPSRWRSRPSAALLLGPSKQPSPLQGDYSTTPPVLSHWEAFSRRGSPPSIQMRVPDRSTTTPGEYPTSVPVARLAEHLGLLAMTPRLRGALITYILPHRRPYFTTTPM